MTYLKTGFIALLFFVLAACDVTPIVPQPAPAPVPDVAAEQYDNLVLCKHKYTPSLNFYYDGQVKSYSEVMFGERVTTLTFTLLDDNEKYLSSQEFENYNCDSVKD